MNGMLKIAVRLQKNVCFGVSGPKKIGSVGRQKFLFFKKFLQRFYRGHILTLIVLIQKLQKKL